MSADRVIRTLAVCLSLAAIFFAFPAQGEVGQTGEGLIRIFAVTRGARTVDVGAPGPSAGDQRISGMILYDRYGRVIGNGYRVCTALDHIITDEVALCEAVYALPRGKLVALGTRSRRDYYVLPVVGGTNLYSTVQGSLVASTISFTPRKERLLFSLES